MIYTADENGMREYSALVAQITRLDAEWERLTQARAQAIEAIKAWEQAHVAHEGISLAEDCPPPAVDPDTPLDEPQQ